MTDTDLIARADAALDGVTEGPWSIDEEGDAIIGPEFSDHEIELVTGFYSDTDMRFIAASRQLVPVLRDALAAANAREAALEAERDRMQLALVRIDDASNHYAMTPTYSEGTLRYAHQSTRNLARAALTGEPQP